MPPPANPTPSELAEITFLRTRISSTHKIRDSLKQSLEKLITRQTSDSSDLSTLLFQINESEGEADLALKNIRMRDYEYWVETIKTGKWVRERCLRGYEELGRKIENVKRDIARLEREIWRYARMLSELAPGGTSDGERTFRS